MSVIGEISFNWLKSIWLKISSFMFLLINWRSIEKILFATSLHDPILIAISSISLAKKNQIKSNLESLKIPIFTIPSIIDIISKKFTIKSNKS